MLLALAVQNVTAFLNENLKKVYMDQPERFPVWGKENFVCKLKHNLYGCPKMLELWDLLK